MTWTLSGHGWAAEMLQRHMSAGQVRHAYLFTGPAGVGRRTLALRFAQALNCPQPAAPGQPCGACRICRLTERMELPDLSVLQSGQEGGELKVDAIRRLQHTLALTPYEAAWRVALLLRAEEANPNAQNALLKTLEEPGARVVLLLTADAAENLLPTIASRCEVLRLRPLALAEMQAALQERGAAPEQAALLAHISGGRPGLAFRLLADETLLEQRQQQLDDLWQMLASSRRERIQWAEPLTKPRSNTREERDQMRDNLRSMFRTWLSVWRDVLLKSSGLVSEPANPDQTARIERLAEEVDAAAARRRIADLETAFERLGSANLQLLIETLLLDLPRLDLQRAF